MFADEARHHLDALLIVKLDHFDSRGAHKLWRAAAFGVAAWEVYRFADDHLWHAELHRGAAAQVTWHQRAVEDGVFVALLAAGVREAVNFGMRHRIVVLHAAVMPAADDLAVANQHAADRQAAFR